MPPRILASAGNILQSESDRPDRSCYLHCKPPAVPIPPAYKRCESLTQTDFFPISVQDNLSLYQCLLDLHLLPQAMLPCKRKYTPKSRQHAKAFHAAQDITKRYGNPVQPKSMVDRKHLTAVEHPNFIPDTAPGDCPLTGSAGSGILQLC